MSICDIGMHGVVWYLEVRRSKEDCGIKCFCEVWKWNKGKQRGKINKYKEEEVKKKKELRREAEIEQFEMMTYKQTSKEG